MRYLILSFSAVFCVGIAFADSATTDCPLEPSMAATPDISRLAKQLAQLGINGRHRVYVDSSSGASGGSLAVSITKESLEQIPFSVALRKSGERKPYDSAHPYVIVEPQTKSQELSIDLVVQPKQSYFVAPHDPNQTWEDRRREDDQRKVVLESIRKDMETGLLPTFFDSPRAYFRLNVRAEMGADMVQFVNERPHWHQLNFSDADALKLVDKLGLFEAVAMARQKLGTNKIKVTSLGRSWMQSWGKESGNMSFGFVPQFEVVGVDELTAVATVYHYFYELMAARYPQVIELDKEKTAFPSVENVTQPGLLRRGLNRLLNFRDDVSIQVAARAVKSEFEKAQAAYTSGAKNISRTFYVGTAFGAVQVGGYVEYQSPNSF